MLHANAPALHSKSYQWLVSSAEGDPKCPRVSSNLQLGGGLDAPGRYAQAQRIIVGVRSLEITGRPRGAAVLSVPIQPGLPAGASTLHSLVHPPPPPSPALADLTSPTARLPKLPNCQSATSHVRLTHSRENPYLPSLFPGPSFASPSRPPRNLRSVEGGSRSGPTLSPPPRLGLAGCSSSWPWCLPCPLWLHGSMPPAEQLQGCMLPLSTRERPIEIQHRCRFTQTAPSSSRPCLSLAPPCSALLSPCCFAASLLPLIDPRPLRWCWPLCAALLTCAPPPPMPICPSPAQQQAAAAAPRHPSIPVSQHPSTPSQRTGVVAK
jgi:hypothetical protein